MKHTIVAFLIITTIAGASPRALQEHVDMHWEYSGEDGWTCVAKTVVNGIDRFEELEDVYLPIDDVPESANGQRYIQAEDERFAFTGVSPENPIWIASQVQQPGQCWPGFNNYQATGTFGAYQETDDRLSGADRAQPFPWITINLDSVIYQGSGSGAFSLWQEDSSGTPTVWFSTSDTSRPDTYLFEAGGHKHLNWGFASPGVYRIRMSASAYVGPGASNPTGASIPFAVTFAVGVLAQWQAAHFTALELDDPLISGPGADPDRDGMKNLVEFGFGFDPRSGVATPVSEGLGLPKLSLMEEAGDIYQVLEYPARRAGRQFAPLSYVPEFSLGMNWQSGSVTTTTDDFPTGLDALNGVWEKVTSRRAVGQVLPTRGFGRVGVVSGE